MHLNQSGSAEVREYLEMVLRSELIPPDGEAVREPRPFDMEALFFAPKSSEVSDEQLRETELTAFETLGHNDRSRAQTICADQGDETIDELRQPASFYPRWHAAGFNPPHAIRRHRSR